MSLTGLLSAVFAAFLAVATIAFGWHPCCCGVTTLCCPGTPTTLHATFTYVSGSCTAFDGLVVTLTYDAVNQIWTGSAGTAPCVLRVTFNCSIFTTWLLAAGVDGDGLQFTAQQKPPTCPSPFALSYTNFTIFATPGTCCAGGTGSKYNVDVTL